ncbi:Dipeptidyl peptidase 3 [Tritrichomonas foetus]|uniref:dipeptidyl-peptidase III n=1 Tax=Tritrichomonas foetus TaxID=1144522 RepID=A0A1J4JAM3_9EUKA|nr:Dipeptidyl peptidase 3 [Tritrichomonas foetus]|eukprot:OHS94308.1 Dipeptidyl peptidase 3 [Tritrichomonas foetus]
MEAPYLCQTGFNVQDLCISDVLKNLNDKTSKYATYLSLATWAGFPILASQSSREALPIHDFLSALVSEFPTDKLKAATGETNTPLFYLLEYGAQFYFNGSNYIGFGDNKFIPRCSKEDVLSILAGHQNLIDLFNKCSERMYSYEPSNCLHLGFHPGGTTTYYDPEDFTEDEQKGIDAVLKEKGVRIENTIIIRHDDHYEVSIASIDVSKSDAIGQFNGKNIIVTHGRHSDTLKKVNHWLTLAKENAENEQQVKMLTALIAHYQTGSVESHEEFSRAWVHDTTMTVEMHHGFIESYRDPSGVRCEYEGLVASVDAKESESLHRYVDNSSTILGLLPYPKEYERKTFTPPSYNAINIITYCSSGMPIGINIPNYDSIRLNEGFKNVSLINVMASSATTPASFNFLEPQQAETLSANFKHVSSFHVASHELFGHGSAGLLHKEDVVGKNIPDLLNPGRFVTTYYEDDATFDSAFGPVASSYEECRAETTALYLAFKPEATDIFNVPADKRQEFALCAVLSMVNSALKTLYCYAPEVSQWKQAHSCARFAILRSLIIWGRGSVKVYKADDGTFKAYVDPSNLEGAHDAVENLLKHLNYYKTTAQVRAGQEFLRSLASFDDFWLAVREFGLTQRPKRSVCCGAIIRKRDNGEYALEAVSDQPKTTFDILSSIATNIKLALE